MANYDIMLYVLYYTYIWISTGETGCPYGHIGGAVSFMYPHIFVAGPNKHDVSLTLHMPTRCEVSTCFFSVQWDID